MDGGIFGFLGLLASHRGAVEYDWRQRFHTSVTEIGKSMSITEAGRLALILRDDPSSMTFAAIAGWAYPLSREALVLTDLFDLQHMTKVKKKPDPYPRPWVAAAQSVRRGNAAGRTPDQIKAILREQFGQPAQSTESEV